ncbi:MAG: YqjK family protein [Pseudomonadota bacterium]
MDDRLIELYVQRGRLRERINAQRGQLAHELAPVSSALQWVDRGRALVHQAQHWLAANPAVIAAVVVAVMVWRPRAVLRAARWGFATWRSWSRLRGLLRAGVSIL